LNRSKDNPLYGESRYGRAKRIRNTIAAHLAALSKKSEYSLETPIRELRNARFILRQLIFMKNATTENRIKSVRSHGFSMPELKKLALLYIQRYVNSTSAHVDQKCIDASFGEYRRDKELDLARVDSVIQIGRIRKRKPIQKGHA